VAAVRRHAVRVIAAGDGFRRARHLAERRDETMQDKPRGDSAEHTESDLEQRQAPDRAKRAREDRAQRSLDGNAERGSLNKRRRRKDFPFSRSIADGQGAENWRFFRRARRDATLETDGETIASVPQKPVDVGAHQRVDGSKSRGVVEENPFLREISEKDRKSTRLNSSH